MTRARNPHLGSALDDLLRHDGSLADAHAMAVERVGVAGRPVDEGSSHQQDQDGSPHGVAQVREAVEDPGDMLLDGKDHVG